MYGAVSRYLRDLSVTEVLHVDVVAAHIAGAGAVGRKLSEHQTRRERIAAQLLQFAAGELEDPVIAACVTVPDAFSIRKQKQLRLIGTDFELFDDQRC